MEAAIRYVETELQKPVVVLVGHSQGSKAILNWFSKSKRNADLIPRVMVSISGRFFPNASPNGRFKPEQIEELETTGKFLWFVRGRECWVDKEAMERRAAMDMLKVTERINAKKGGTMFVLMHGSADETVPVEDGEELSRWIDGAQYTRIEGASHNFNGVKHLNELLAPILMHI